MDLLDLAKKRCSVRQYAATPVEKEKLDYILEVARLAPSAVNFQPWQFLVVSTKENLEKVQSCYEREWLKTAPLCIIACEDHAASWKRGSDGKDHTSLSPLSISVSPLPNRDWARAGSAISMLPGAATSSSCPIIWNLRSLSPWAIRRKARRKDIRSGKR